MPGANSRGRRQQKKVENLQEQEKHQMLRADTLQKELEEVRHQLLENQVLVKRLTAENETLKHDMEAIKEEVCSDEVFQEFCVELSSKLTVQEETSQALQKKVKDLKMQENDQRLRADGFEKELKVVRLQHVETANKDLLVIEGLTEEKSALGQDLKALEKEALLKGKQLQGLQDLLQQETSRCLELSSNLKVQEETNQALQKKVEDLKMQEEHQRMRADGLDKELEDVRLQLVDTENKGPLVIECLTEEKSSLKQEVKALEKEAMLKGKQLQGLQNQLQQETSRCLELSSNLTVQVETNQALQKKVEDLKMQEEHHRLRADGLDKELEDVRLVSECLTEEKSELKQDMKALEKEALLKGKQLQGLQNQLQQETSQLLQKKVENLQEQEKHQKLRADTLQKELEEVRHQLLEISDKNQVLVERLTAENETLEHEMEAIKEEVCSNDVFCLELYSKLTVQEETSQALQKKVEDLKMQEEHQRMRADGLDKELEDVRLQLLDTGNKSLFVMECLTEEKSSLEQDLKALEKEAMLKGKQLQGLHNQLQQETSRCLELSSNLTVQEETNQALQKKVEDLKMQEEHQRLRADGLNNELAEVRLHNVETANKDLLVIEGFTEEKSSLEQDITALQKEAMLNGKQLQGLPDLLQQETSRCLELSSKLSAEEEANQVLEEKVEVLQNEMRQEEISLWRKLKKAFTPTCRRQFKQQKKQMLSGVCQDWNEEDPNAE